MMVVKMYLFIKHNYIAKDLEFYVETQNDNRRKAIDVTGSSCGFCKGQERRQFNNNRNYKNEYNSYPNSYGMTS